MSKRVYEWVNVCECMNEHHSHSLFTVRREHSQCVCEWVNVCEW